MASASFNRELALVIVVLIVGSIVGSDPVIPAVARLNDATVRVADNAAPGGATSTMTPAKHRYWRHHGGTHPHFGSRRVRVPQSSASPRGDE